MYDLADQLLELDTSYELPTNHYLWNGMYAREMFALAGTMIVGATHKKPCLNVLLVGEIVISNGEKEVVLKAPQVIPQTAGIQKAGYALTDVIWLNVFTTDATTVEEAEDDVFENDFKEYKSKRKKLKEIKCQVL